MSHKHEIGPRPQTPGLVHATRFTSARMRALTTVAATLLLTTAALADVRFYRINKKGQETETEFVFNTDETGCHNLPLARNVHRVAQVRFEFCEVFTKADCDQSSIVEANWGGKRKRSKDKQHPTTKLSPGAMWLLSETGNVKIKSWRCQ